VAERRILKGVPNTDVAKTKRRWERQGWHVEVTEDSPGDDGTSTLTMTKPPPADA
jgi:hypothetical protein